MDRPWNCYKINQNLKNNLKNCREDMIQFLIDIINIPSESGQEEKVIQRTKEEMEKVGFDSVEIDKMGNVIGKIGNGKKIIAMDAHLDTVGIGRLNDWKTDPLNAVVIDNNIYGRGAVDQKAGMASMIYAAKMIKENNLLNDFTLYIVGSVQEEDCDGLCWRYIIDQGEILPDCVVITEPTNLNINIGQRGRMEVEITVKGKSSHGSMPEFGINAIYAMNRIIQEIELLNNNTKKDLFLGNGTVSVTEVRSKSPSLCSVPDECSIHLDRRLTTGENRETVLEELQEIITKSGVDAKVKILTYEKPSYNNTIYPTECYFPTWKLPEDHELLLASSDTYKMVFEEDPVFSKWVFSTNGTVTMGVYNIPTIGFGPGNEIHAHAPNEFVPVEDLMKAARWYALFPYIYTLLTEEKK